MKGGADRIAVLKEFLVMIFIREFFGKRMCTFQVLDSVTCFQLY